MNNYPGKQICQKKKNHVVWWNVALLNKTWNSTTWGDSWWQVQLRELQSLGRNLEHKVAGSFVYNLSLTPSPDSIHKKGNSKRKKLGSLDNNARAGLWSLTTHTGVSPMQVPKEESLGAKGVPIATTHKLHQNSPKFFKVVNQPPPNLQTNSGARQTDRHTHRQMLHNLQVTFPVLYYPQKSTSSSAFGWRWSLIKLPLANSFFPHFLNPSILLLLSSGLKLRTRALKHWH